MNKTFLIFRHEFITTLKRTGFIVMTIILPVLALLAIGIAQLISVIAKPPVVEKIAIGYVDEVGGFEQYTTQDNIKIVRFDSKEGATEALIKKDISEYFIIPSDYISKGIIQRYTLEKQLETPAATETAIKNFLTSNLLSDEVPEDVINRVESPLYIVVTRITETGAVATEQGGFGNVIIPGIFSLLLALSLNFYSAYLVQGLGEEKESRLMEVLLSSVSTRQLLIGKVLGLGIAGLVQVLVWLISAPLLLGLASSLFGGFISSIQLPANFIILGIIYFILGFLLFAALSASVGAISPTAREGQQMTVIYSLLAIVPLWLTSLLFFFPNNPLWIVLTLFPITAPVEAMLRMGVSDIPVWQLIVSILLLILSIIAVMFITIKIFRIYLLMYGKRPNLSEIMRRLRTG
jgi:ABC-2 type transport system permease protein